MSANRLGERLVAGGIVSREALGQALELQAVHGGRIGTCLVDVGALQLDDVARALAAHHGVPAALEHHFERAEPAVQSRLSAELAAELSVVPLAVVPGEPFIACAAMDPLSEDDTRELASALESGVIVAVAPQLRILYHLERAYGIERPNRFRRIARPRDPTEPPTPEEAEGRERRRYVQTLSEGSEVEAPSTLARIAVRRVHVPSTDVVETLPDVSDLDEALLAIRRATGRQRVGALVVAALEQGFGGAFDAGMLLTVRAATLMGWKGFVKGGDDRVVEAIAVPLDVPSSFAEPCLTATSHFGPPRGSSSEVDDRLWLAFGDAPPTEIGIHPVSVFGKLACVLYVQTHGEMPPAAAGGVAELGQGLAAALERLVKADER